jgi:Tfp pilus assembly protein PilO
MKTLLYCGLAAALFWYGALGPLRDEVHALETRLASQAPQIQSARALAVALPALQREVQELETALEVFRNSDEPGDLNGLVAELQAAAADAELRITGLKIRPQAVREGGPDRAVELAIEGTYPAVDRFLTRLSSSAKLTTTPEVTVAARRDGRGSGANLAGSVVVFGFDLSSEQSDETFPEYHESARRDPFEAVTRPALAMGPPAVGSDGKGLASVPLADVIVSGVARNERHRLAILETSARRSFVVRPLDRLADSVVHDVVESGVVFLSQNGNSGVVQVHKPVRPASGARP